MTAERRRALLALIGAAQRELDAAWEGAVGAATRPDAPDAPDVSGVPGVPGGGEPRAGDAEAETALLLARVLARGAERLGQGPEETGEPR